jgi:hypothetical protein
MKIAKKIAYVLVIVGGINWGLFGLFGLDLIEAVFGNLTMIARALYTLVGLSALFMIFAHKMCEDCDCNCCGGTCSCGKDVREIGEVLE